MDLGLKGKIALVAGASKGLGKAVAMGLASEGAHVAIISRHEALVQVAAKEIQTATGAQVLPIAADVMRPDDIQRAVDETVGTDALQFHPISRGGTGQDTSDRIGQRRHPRQQRPPGLDPNRAREPMITGPRRALPY